MAENAIVYEAAEDAAESIAAAWFPEALLQASPYTFYYADQATRKIVEFDTKTQEKRVLFDLSGYEHELFGADAYEAVWGTALIHVDDNWIVAAAPHSALVWMNTSTGAIEIVGQHHPQNGVLPQDGARLGNVDFELFGGIARTAAGFYIVLGQQIFYIL